MPDSTIPDFRWAAFYYPEIVTALVLMKRQSWPEHTEEDPHDPVIQLYRLFATLAHLQAVRLDHAARELYFPTLRLRSSMIAAARGLGISLATAVPAESQVVADLSSLITTPTTVLLEGSIFGTDALIEFEYEGEDLAVDLTGAAAWSVLEDTEGTFDDITGDLPEPLWGAPDPQNAVYFVGSGAMFNKIGLTLTGSPVMGAVRWEYPDDFRELAPDLVTVNGGTLQIRVYTLIGASRADGLEVTVTCLKTGQSETIEVAYSGGYNRIVTTGYLGQVVPSTSPGDYLVSSEWTELPDLTDGTAGLTTTGDVTWSLPETTARRWAKADPDASGVDRWMIRARVANLAESAVAPTLAAITEPRRTTWSVRWDVRQGRTVEDRIGTTDEGSADQAFTLSQTPFISLSSLLVGDLEWTIVDNFLSSSSSDRHAQLREEPDGSWVIKFGNGTNGRIPDASLVVTATYRIGGADSGNVGALTIIRDRTGNSKLRNFRNPRAAAGWVAQEGTTAASLDTLRDSIPAAGRALDRAVTLEDYETIARAFRTADGSQVAVRAMAKEEGAGPKTVVVYCVGPGGTVPGAADLAELEEHFNGVTVGVQQVGGKAPANTRVTVAAYSPVTVPVTATIRVLSAFLSGANAAITAALAATLSPLAKRLELDSDGNWVEGSTYLWTWEGPVDPTMLQVGIATGTPGIVSVVIAVPAASFDLEEGELPVPPSPATFTLTITGVG